MWLRFLIRNLGKSRKAGSTKTFQQITPKSPNPHIRPLRKVFEKTLRCFRTLYQSEALPANAGFRKRNERGTSPTKGTPAPASRILQQVQRGARYTDCSYHSNSLSNKRGNSLLAVRGINHKYIVVERRSSLRQIERLSLSRKSTAFSA